MKNLGVLIAFMVGVPGGACGGGNSTAGEITAMIGAVPWRTSGKGFIITTADRSTTFTVQGATPLPNSPLLDPSKPELVVVFSQVPSVGTGRTARMAQP
jgi:hypothetical protein